MYEKFEHMTNAMQNVYIYIYIKFYLTHPISVLICGKEINYKLLENIRKEQVCHVSRYQSLKVRIVIEGKMACQKEEQCFSEAEPCCLSRVSDV